MSDLIVNIRFGTRHLQISRSGRVSFARNTYHAGWPEGFFEVIQFPGFRP